MDDLLVECLAFFTLSVYSLLGCQTNHIAGIDTVFKHLVECPEVLIIVTFVNHLCLFSSVTPGVISNFSSALLWWPLLYPSPSKPGVFLWRDRIYWSCWSLPLQRYMAPCYIHRGCEKHLMLWVKFTITMLAAVITSLYIPHQYVAVDPEVCYPPFSHVNIL